MENCFLCGDARDDGRDTLETAKSTALKLCLPDGDGVDDGDDIRPICAMDGLSRPRP